MPEYKFNEVSLITELQAYIDSTYGQHYANGKIQSLEFISDQGHGLGFLIGDIIKYAARYGKKQGYNRADLMKIAHYAILMLNEHDKNVGAITAPAQDAVKLKKPSQIPTLWSKRDLEVQERAGGVAFHGSGFRRPSSTGFCGSSGPTESIFDEIAAGDMSRRIGEILREVPPPLGDAVATTPDLSLVD